MENWTLENFMIVGMAMWKMFTFFWPVVLVAIIGSYHIWRSEKEEKNELKSNL